MELKIISKLTINKITFQKNKDNEFIKDLLKEFEEFHTKFDNREQRYERKKKRKEFTETIEIKNNFQLNDNSDDDELSLDFDAETTSNLQDYKFQSDGISKQPNKKQKIMEKEIDEDIDFILRDDSAPTKKLDHFKSE